MFEWIETCESTSKALKDRIKAGINEPLALAAAEQAAGVGRLGRTWSSQKGNLHLSLAFPPGFLNSDILNILPVAIGALAAEWVAKEFDLSICLKWPNDLFLDGKKIGGILCEAIYEGSQLQGVVVGMGINLTTCPQVLNGESWDYLPGQLLPNVQDKQEVKDTAKSLTKHILESIMDLNATDILKRWQKFAIKSGHQWIRQKSIVGSELGEVFERFSDHGIDVNGQLKIVPTRVDCSENKMIFVSSVANELTWALPKEGDVLVADVGNTLTKLAIATIKDQIKIKKVFSGDNAIAELSKALNEPGVPHVIHAVSVNPEGLERLKTIASSQGLTVRELQRQPVGLLKSKYDLQVIGMDRLAALEAFMYLKRSGQGGAPAIIVSLGTATTLDVVDGQGCHLGGYIIAGLQTSLDVMSNRGRDLPKSLDTTDVFKRQSEGHWPTSSREAMLHGVVQMTLSFLVKEKEKLAKYCGVDVDTVRVYLAGGFADHIKDVWAQPNLQSDPYLTLLGTAVLASNGR